MGLGLKPRPAFDLKPMHVLAGDGWIAGASIARGWSPLGVGTMHLVNTAPAGLGCRW